MPGPINCFNTLALINASGGSAGELDDLVAELDWRGCEVHVGTNPDAARERLARALHRGVEAVIVGGGDGTIHTLVNWMEELRQSAPGSGSRRVHLGLLPLGTGNDFCRGLGIPLGRREALDVVLTGVLRSVDALRYSADASTELITNMFSAAPSGSRILDSAGDEKGRFGRYAYAIKAIPEMLAPTLFEAHITLDDAPPIKRTAAAVFVANGPSSSGGFSIVPPARPDDGWLDVMIIREGTLTENLDATIRLALGGHHLALKMVQYHRARRVRIESTTAVVHTADGEVLTERRDAVLEVMPSSLSVIVPR